MKETLEFKVGDKVTRLRYPQLHVSDTLNRDSNEGVITEILDDQITFKSDHDN